MILFKSRHGFTLIEMIIVMILLGIIFGTMNYLSPGPRISRAKSERIATTLQDSIKTAQRDILTGKAPSSNIPVIKKIVTISVGPTPRITTKYITANSQTGTESTLNYPFYDGDKKFQLRDISLFATRPSAGIEQLGGSFVSFTGLTNISIAFNTDHSIILDSTDPAFVSAKNAGFINQSNIRYTIITTGYDAYEVKTRIDRVSGIVDALPMFQNTGTIISPPIYAWNTSDYSLCSLSCGGGTQTRTVMCHDINENTVTDSFCDPALKPDFSQSCNTQVCPINGTCGSADGVPSSTLPNFGLCASGSGSTPITNPAVSPAINDYWIWTCSGSNSGSSNNCSALKQTNYCIAGGVISCIASGAISPPVSPYAVCTTAGQTYTATTTYPGCSEADKIVCTGNNTGYTWAMCNVGSNIAGTGNTSYGELFQWGRNTPVRNAPELLGKFTDTEAVNNTTNFLAATGAYLSVYPGLIPMWGMKNYEPFPYTSTYYSDNIDKTKIQGPCLGGYHIPTYKEFVDIVGGINPNFPQNSTSFVNDSIVMNKLLLPPAGMRYKYYVDYTSQYYFGGYYWTASKFVFGVKTNQITMANDMIETAYSIRCIKN